MTARRAARLAAVWLGLALAASAQSSAGGAVPRPPPGGAGAADAGDASPAALPALPALPAPLPAEARLIAVGASLTVTVCALGAAERLIATDDGGRELPAAAHLPSVGYARTLSAEGLLALSPDALLVGPEAGPPAVLAQVAAAGPRVIVLPLEASEDGACERIRTLAALLGRPERGEQLVQSLRTELADLRAALARRESPAPRVLFLYARSATSLHAAGAGTPGDAMLRLAGASNVLSGVEGYTLLTPEAAVGAAPEALVLPARSLEVMGGLEALAAHPGLSLTPAVREGRVVALDDLLLLGFGPATGRGARLLATRLDPRLAVSEPASDATGAR